jgi:hypothetical protein
MSTYIKNVSDLNNIGTLDSAADKVVVVDATDSKPKLITVDDYNTQAGISLKENSSNKSTNVVADSASNVKFPSVKAVYDWVVGLLSAKEDLSNKSTSVIADLASNTKYPSVKAVYDWAIGIFAGKENLISAGTTSQYYRGDKTFQTLDKTAVGLSNVQNVDQTSANNITSGTLNDARLSSTVVKSSAPVNLNNQTLFNYKKNITAVGSSGVFQVTNTHHGYAFVIGHGSGTVTVTFTATVEAGAEFDFWVYTTQGIEFTAVPGMTIYLSNGVSVVSPTAYNLPTPQRGKKVKAFCPSANVILISGDIV